MPIAKLKPSNTTPIKPHIPKHVPPSYKTVTINEKEIPKHQLLAYISGSSWSVDYYQQVLGEDDDVKEYIKNTIRINLLYINSIILSAT